MSDTEATAEIHTCDNDSLEAAGSYATLGTEGQSARCRTCERVWWKANGSNTWYDPAEGTDPSASDEEADERAQMAWADRQFYGHA